MSIRQLSVFLENKRGHLGAALDTLAGGEVNVLSFTIADTTDYGILRLIVDDIEKAKALLTSADYSVVEHPVVWTQMPDRPGVLARITNMVSESGLDIEYIYLGGRDSLLLKTDEHERLEAMLRDAGFEVLGPDDIG